MAADNISVVCFRFSLFFVGEAVFGDCFGDFGMGVEGVVDIGCVFRRLNPNRQQGATTNPRPQYANLIHNNWLGEDCQQIGSTWVGQFLQRHHDKLQMHWSKPLDMQRAQSMNPEAKKRWFELLKEFVVNTGIRPEDLYGMDETGCPPSNQGTEHVCGSRGTKTQHKQGGADHENVTAIVTICADGTTLQPTIIFKGQNFMTKWTENNLSGASSVHTLFNTIDTQCAQPTDWHIPQMGGLTVS